MMDRKGPARYKPDRRWDGVGISRRIVIGKGRFEEIVIIYRKAVIENGI